MYTLLGWVHYVNLIWLAMQGYLAHIPDNFIIKVDLSFY
jgi:hypothetical protein